MADLGIGQKPIVMPHYPHLHAGDREVWSKFLEAEGHRLKEVWYDVHVGQGVVLPVGASDMERRIALGVTRKRIDVVARVGGGFWVVEIKPLASMRAVGQVITYTRLFILEYSPQGEVWPVIVSDAYDEDLVDEFDELGIVVIVND